MRKSQLIPMLVLGACSIVLDAGAEETKASGSDTQKIGTVDMQKALQSVEAGKKAKAQLEKDYNAKKKELQNEEAAIKKMDAELKKQSLVLNEEARQKKIMELQERIQAFQQTTLKSQQEIQQKEHELTEPIVGKLRAIIKDTAKAKGYNLILEKNENTVLFSQEKDDLTTEVVNLYNKQGKS
jgi:outer membrane protein